MAHKIQVRIIIEGGVIQAIEKPNDVEVEVLDFDTEDEDEIGKENVRANEKGEKYYYNVW